MGKTNLATIAKDIRKFASKRSPEILTGIGIAGMITTTILAVRATPKALELIEEQKEEESVDELSSFEVVKVAWKPYIPAMVTCIASTACLIGASSVNTKRDGSIWVFFIVNNSCLIAL